MSLKRGLVRNKKYKSAADDDKSGPGYPRRQQWRHFVIHQGPKISGDREGDSIWKPSNTTETTKWGVCYLALRDFLQNSLGFLDTQLSVAIKDNSDKLDQQ